MLCIDGVLAPDEAAAYVQALATSRFRDGRTSAGYHAATVKANLQAEPDDPAATALKTVTVERLRTHALFQLAARPKRLSSLIVSRYDPGMAYGAHVDDALMGDLRTDLAFTLFLCPPESYDGGALVIDGSAGEHSVKLSAGALVLYPATTLHRVEPVTRGQRLAVVGWVESRIRGSAEREILFDLDTARAALYDRDGKSAIFDLLSKSSANLLRLWAQT